jgi:hypothetical protein
MRQPMRWPLRWFILGTRHRPDDELKLIGDLQ